MTKDVPEMVERVAKGIFVADFDEEDWPKVTEDVRDIFRIRARAAIAAMREPTEAMTEQGSEAVDPDNDNGIWDIEHNGPYLTVEGAKTMFQAMIDEALKDN